MLTGSFMVYLNPVTCPVISLVAGRGKRQQVVEPLPHFFHPGASLWLFLRNRLPLFNWKRDDLQRRFRRLGGCVSPAIGGRVKTSLSSGFLNTIDIWCIIKLALYSPIVTFLTKSYFTDKSLVRMSTK